MGKSICHFFGMVVTRGLTGFRAPVAVPEAVLIWDVVRVDFPYAGSENSGVRPALLIAAPDATDTFTLVWVLMITSARHVRWPDDVEVTDLTAAGLWHPSIIRTAKIAAIDSRLATTIGRLTETDRAAVSRRLMRHLSGVLPA